jgi:hypothetical protein
MSRLGACQINLGYWHKLQQGVIAMEESYRGYRITADQSYGVWRLWVNPIHPHLPILQHPQFVCDGPMDEALRDARSRVDALLASQS